MADHETATALQFLQPEPSHWVAQVYVADTEFGVFAALCRAVESVGCRFRGDVRTVPGDALLISWESEYDDESGLDEAAYRRLVAGDDRARRVVRVWFERDGRSFAVEYVRAPDAERGPVGVSGWHTPVAVDGFGRDVLNAMAEEARVLYGVVDSTLPLPVPGALADGAELDGSVYLAQALFDDDPGLLSALRSAGAGDESTWPLGRFLLGTAQSRAASRMVGTSVVSFLERDHDRRLPLYPVAPHWQVEIHSSLPEVEAFAGFCLALETAGCRPRGVLEAAPAGEPYLSSETPTTTLRDVSDDEFRRLVGGQDAARRVVKAGYDWDGELVIAEYVYASHGQKHPIGLATWSQVFEIPDDAWEGVTGEQASRLPRWSRDVMRAAAAEASALYGVVTMEFALPGPRDLAQGETLSGEIFVSQELLDADRGLLSGLRQAMPGAQEIVWPHGRVFATWKYNRTDGGPTVHLTAGQEEAVARSVGEAALCVIGHEAG